MGGNLADLIAGDDVMPIFLKIAKKVLLLSVFLMFGSSIASAQTAGVGTWPTQKPIRLIAVFPPGGSVDPVSYTHLTLPTTPYV